jgi:Tol biopolymer transport system component
MWSPDGRYLAFRRSTDCDGERPYPRDVVISDATGNVLAAFPAQGWDIMWSPDATRVAVWDSFGETIGIYGLDGSRQAQLTMPDWWSVPGDVDPGWVPDGASVFVDPNVELPLDGGAPRRLPGGAPNDPAGDPDGFDIGVDHGALKLARTDGSGSVTLVAAERGTELEAIAVSPEGDRVLFSKIEDGEPSLWSIGVDGSDPRLIVAGTTQGEWLLR